MEGNFNDTLERMSNWTAVGNDQKSQLLTRFDEPFIHF